MRAHLVRPCEQRLVRALAAVRGQRVKDNVLLGHVHQVLHVVGLGRVPRIELLLHAKGHAVTQASRDALRGEGAPSRLPNSRGGNSGPNELFLI